MRKGFLIFSRKFKYQKRFQKSLIFCGQYLILTMVKDEKEVKDWIEDKRKKCKEIHNWKKFPEKGGYIVLSIKFNPDCTNYDLFLNRQRERHELKPEKGCVIPIGNAKEVSDWLAMQIIPEFAYQQGTSKTIEDATYAKFELIKEFKDKRDLRNSIKLSYMINDYGNKYFLQNKSILQKQKKGVEIPLELIRDIIIEIRRFWKLEMSYQDKEDKHLI